MQLRDGQQYQDFVVDLLLNTLRFPIVTYSSRLYQQQVGESANGAEIKHDKRYAGSGNLYIELAEKARPRPGAYAASGINRADNTWLYIIGNYDTVFVFAKTILQSFAASGRYRQVETPTSQGYLLPDDVAQRSAAVVLAPNAEQKIVKAVRDLAQLGRLLNAVAKTHPAQASLLTLLDKESAQ